MPLAFEWVAIAVMLAEVNFSVEALKLEEPLPVTYQRLTHKYIAPPQIMYFGGRLDTARYSFGFGTRGRLRFITKRDPYDGLAFLEAGPHLARSASLITTNEAYSIATNWLVRMCVDVREMEKANRSESEQCVYWEPTSDDPKRVPIFEVVWRNSSGEIVRVRIDGRTKELIHLRLEDDSFSRRPAELIKDRDALLAIPDEEFRTYSVEQ